MQSKTQSNSVMETRDHSKNEASLKSHTSRRNFLKAAFCLSIFAAVAMLSSCRSSLPATFVRSTDGGSWTQIPLRENMDFEATFDKILDRISRTYEMEMIAKESGYARSQWATTWNTKGKNSYRTRVVFKFSLDRKTLEVKTDAEYGRGDYWIRGFDAEVLRTVKQDIMAIVGRTTF